MIPAKRAARKPAKTPQGRRLKAVDDTAVAQFAEAKTKLPDLAYEMLEEAIVTLKLPPGAVVSEQALTDMTGIGPWRWVAGEYVQGSRAVYSRNADYIPREEEADAAAGTNPPRYGWCTGLADVDKPAEVAVLGDNSNTQTYARYLYKRSTSSPSRHNEGGNLGFTQRGRIEAAARQAHGRNRPIST